MKRSVVAALGGFDESLSSWEDLDLQLRIAVLHSLAFVPEYLVGYRVRPGSLSQDPSNMFSSWLRIRTKVRRSFPQFPRFVHRWAHGTRCAHFAESFAWNGRYATCALLLMQALAHDPRWTLSLLRYRSARHLSRRLFRQKVDVPRPHFLECDPTKSILPEPLLSDVGGRPLRKLHRIRVRRLETLDESVAPSVTPRLRAEAG